MVDYKRQLSKVRYGLERVKEFTEEEQAFLERAGRGEIKTLGQLAAAVRAPYEAVLGDVAGDESRREFSALMQRAMKCYTPQEAAEFLTWHMYVGSNTDTKKVPSYFAGLLTTAAQQGAAAPANEFMQYSNADRAYITIPFGELIHRMRLLTGSSFKMISDYMGPGEVSVAQLFRIEKGTKYSPDKPVLERLEHYFRLPPAFLYNLWGVSSGHQKPRRAEWGAQSFARNIFADPDSKTSWPIAKFIYGVELLTVDEAQRLVNLLTDPTLGKERES